jgi:hypothetical protein
MTTLRITTGPQGFSLASCEPLNGYMGWIHHETYVPFGSFSTRPDPIQRSWARLEAKRGMASEQESPATPRPCTPEKPKGLLGWIRSPATPQVDPGASCEVQR